MQTLSALPVINRCSLAGLKVTARISDSCASTFTLGSNGDLVSQLVQILSVVWEASLLLVLHHKHFVISYAGKNILMRGMPIYVLRFVSRG